MKNLNETNEMDEKNNNDERNNNVIKNESLVNIEEKIIQLSKQESNRWAEMAQLMLMVKNEKLHEIENLSFTQWIRTLAERAKIHESLLWRQLKAGSYYLKLKAFEASETSETSVENNQNTKQKIDELPKMEDFKKSPDVINLVKDITGNNIREGQKLLHKFCVGEVTRKDLSAARIAVNRQRELAGIKRAANGYERDKIEKAVAGNTEDNAELNVLESGLSAAKILATLQQNSDWIPALELSESENFMRQKFKAIYHIFSEFPVNTGDAKHVRRIDAFVFENLTSPSTDIREMVLRGIEIKIAKNDLLKDEKMAEYANYCDFFYVAVPPELKEDAKSIMLPEWGLLLISPDGKIVVEQEAQKLRGIFRSSALSTGLYLLL